MNRLSRRAFGKFLLASAFVPASRIDAGETPAQQKSEIPSVPQLIGGYKLSDEERELAAKFLADHETQMAPLRQVDLPNALPPHLSFTVTPVKTSLRGNN